MPLLESLLRVYVRLTYSRERQVAQIIDPEQKLFRENIVSRDECGSINTFPSYIPLYMMCLPYCVFARVSGMNSKNLQRIFPVDDSMVLIVDDRVDVWQTSKNLFKIEPCT